MVHMCIPCGARTHDLFLIRISLELPSLTSVVSAYANSSSMACYLMPEMAATVSILAQGASWTVAVTQIFFF